MNDEKFDQKLIEDISNSWVQALASAYQVDRPFPANRSKLPEIPTLGGGSDRLPELWKMIVDESAHLATPWMSGHMDTAPHPVAALTSGLVAALNNNMLFRELSPLASDVEEALVDYFIAKLNLGTDWAGTFASGGSIANLTALFSAVGGFDNVASREKFHLLTPASGHLSLTKSANVLGISNERIHKIPCDEGGRLSIAALKTALRRLPQGAKPIVACVVGTTIHGSIDDVGSISKLCKQYSAWLHIDLIYGAGLMFSHQHAKLICAHEGADSIVLGPQKWMYVPRVSAVVLIRGQDVFDRTLGVTVPYSLGGGEHRGKWGLQGSRPADALVLWTLLQTIGTDSLGSYVDSSIATTKKFHTELINSKRLQPSHQPDLNLQTFRVDQRDEEGVFHRKIHKRLTENGRSWFSLSRWDNETIFRAVFLSPAITDDHIIGFIDDIEKAIS